MSNTTPADPEPERPQRRTRWRRCKRSLLTGHRIQVTRSRKPRERGSCCLLRPIPWSPNVEVLEASERRLVDAQRASALALIAARSPR